MHFKILSLAIACSQYVIIITYFNYVLTFGNQIRKREEVRGRISCCARHISLEFEDQSLSFDFMDGLCDY